jgi:hypothetical protein
MATSLNLELKESRPKYMTQNDAIHCCECARIDAKNPGCSHRARYSVNIRVVHDDLKDVHLCPDHLAMLWSALRNRVAHPPITVKGFARMHAQ